MIGVYVCQPPCIIMNDHLTPVKKTANVCTKQAHKHLSTLLSVPAEFSTSRQSLDTPHQKIIRPAYHKLRRQVRIIHTTTACEVDLSTSKKSGGRCPVYWQTFAMSGRLCHMLEDAPNAENLVDILLRFEIPNRSEWWLMQTEFCKLQKNDPGG